MSTLEGHIDRIYQAALAPERWPEFLVALREELRAASLHLTFRLASDGDRGILLSLGMDETFKDSYLSHFYRLNPLRPFYPELKEGAVVVGETLIGVAELKRTEFYNDWMRPQGIAHSFTSILLKPSQVASTLVGFRDSQTGCFQREEFDRIGLLVPHLQGALMIHHRLRSAELRAAAAEDALDRIFGGVILLDERWSPVTTNRSAERILATNDGLALDREGPAASSPEQTGALRRALAGAAKTGAGKAADAGAFLRLRRPSGREPLEVAVTPIRSGSSPLFDRRAVAAIFVAEPDAPVGWPPQRLQGLYGFTRVEAEVASRMLEGMDLAEISDALGITIHTVRGHLKQLFAKTGTHRQQDLVRVLATGLAGLRRR